MIGIISQCTTISYPPINSLSGMPATNFACRHYFYSVKFTNIHTLKNKFKKK